MAKAPKNTTNFVPYPAPDFNLASSAGGMVSLSEIKGSWAIIFLYPTDNTPTCTVEARAFSDEASKLQDMGVRLFGLSKDSLKDHAKFISKYDLKMPLLSDPDTQTIEAFGSWVEKKLYGRDYMGTDRSTFIIDPKGMVRAVWRKVKVKDHINDVLTSLNALMIE